MVECATVKPIKFSLSPRDDGGSSWGVVHECKFSEELSRGVALHIDVFTLDHLIAVVLASLDDEKSISLLALLDDGLIFLDRDFFHSVDNNADIFFIQALEEDNLLHERSDLLLGFRALGDHLGLKLLFFVVNAEHLSADRLPAHFFLLMPFLLFCQFLLKGSPCLLVI